jgi:hypothetical protein
MMIILAIPLCLLCSYISCLCYQKKFYPQAWTFGALAFFLLLFSVGFIGASYYAWIELKV